jgi:hypothetical protein
MPASRCDTEAGWIATNPTLAAGVYCISLDVTITGSYGLNMYRYKIADGVNTWKSLLYTNNVTVLPDVYLDASGDLAVGSISAAGYSGYSGTAGGTGVSGYSGVSGVGTSGYSGVWTSGYSGTSGIDGTSGYSGIDGASGYSGT